jgi:broad specificity phosphatase PhoE
MANLLIIRHGQASFGADNYDQLSALGQHQADLTGEFLSQSGVQLSAAFSGDLSRQRDHWSSIRGLTKCKPMSKWR